MMANIIPNTFTAVTGFPRIKSEQRIMKTRFEAFATANVKEVTIDIIVNANIFCNQFSKPSANNNAIIKYGWLTLYNEKVVF